MSRPGYFTSGKKVAPNPLKVGWYPRDDHDGTEKDKPVPFNKIGMSNP